VNEIEKIYFGFMLFIRSFVVFRGARGERGGR
jgi:hypothetical protein